MMVNGFKMDAEIAAIDSWIRQNQIELASHALLQLVKKPIPRHKKVAVAALCRRLRLPQIGMRLLHPVVRPTRPLKQPSTPQEQAEYAALLYRLGATVEARSLLTKICPKTFPKSQLYLAFVLVTSWEYEAAAKELEGYLARTDPDSYDALVARVNLVAAHVYCGQHNVGAEELSTLLRQVRSENNRLLETNLLELAAQNEFGREDYSKSASFLDEAERLATKAPFLDFFFIQKWRAFLSLVTPLNAPKIDGFSTLRCKAVSLKHWESVRDLDFHLALYQRDEKLLGRVYHGTPFVPFRARIARQTTRLWGSPFDGTGQYDFKIGEGESEPVIWDLCGYRSVKPNQVIHRLLLSLTSDFYRPFRLAELFNSVFPNEHFTPASSPGRVYQAVHRLKSYFENSKIPLTVHEENGFFSLQALAGNSVLPRGLRNATFPLASSKTKMLLERLPLKWKSTPFIASQLSKKVKIPKRSLNRYLSEAVGAKLLIRRGSGSRTEYRFPPSRQKT